MRERELKPREGTKKASAIESLPMRERELKLYLPCLILSANGSLPMRERELKPARAFSSARATPVAPHAGA